MSMLKRLMAAALALLLPATALAEIYEGQTEALETVAVTAEISGSVEGIETQVGARVSEGDVLARLRSGKVFASQDGAVARVQVGEGETANGTVLEVAPMEKYLVYCTVDGAYQAAENTLIHSGETLYIRCTSDGSHRAVGVVAAIDGEEYRVLTLGGELYVGETVNLYRGDDFAAESRVGKGTVTAGDTEAYEAEGDVTRLLVAAGDAVERGQLLYEVGGGTLYAPASGIVSAVSVQPGDAVEADQAVAEIVPDGQVCVTFQVEEADAVRIAAGRRVELILPGDAEETVSGIILDVARIAEGGKYAVRALPEDGVALPLGMTVRVRV